MSGNGKSVTRQARGSGHARASSGAGQFAGFSRWCFAGQAAHHQPTAAKVENYQAQFFKPEEYRLITHLAELIIPRDESPGATDAGVGEFIDFMIAHDEDLQPSFRSGISWLNAFAAREYGSDFLTVGAGKQVALLSRLAYRNRQSSAELEGQKFFKLIREYTVMGYYTSRVGLEQLDYPGLKAYSASPECPHKDDPEHLHLSKART